MSFWREIEAQIEATTQRPFLIQQRRPLSGGCINEAARLVGEDVTYFIKINRAAMLEMFVAEAEGLQEMLRTETIRVPQPICWGAAETKAWLVLEWVPLNHRVDMVQLGEQLASMHRHTADRYGWSRDNTIGSSPQHNPWTRDWSTFWQEQRLGYQLELAQRHGASTSLLRKGERLLSACNAFFQDYRPRPSLLHGDLWSGNWGGDDQGRPVIYDPAVYYGDHEADLAMMELFGNPGADFYAAYEAVFPLDTGYPLRKTFYNLYHILNHFNLFSGGYAYQAENMIEMLLSELQ